MVQVIKVYLEDSGTVTQIRRIAIGSHVVSSFPLLMERIRSLFQLQSTNLELKWKDPENDLILMSTDGELSQAIANADDGLLKLYVYEKKSEPTVKQNELKKDSKPNSEGEQHPLVVCDGCEQNIFGDRYKCLQCKNFDLCSSCNNDNKHPHHDMIKLVKPIFVPRDWEFLGARNLWRSMFGRCPSYYFRNTSSKQATAACSFEDSPNQSSNSGRMENAVSRFLNGDFIPAQKLLSEGLGNFLQNWPGGVDIKLESDTSPCHHYKQRAEKNTKTDTEKEEKSASTSGKQEEKVAKQDEEVAEKVTEKDEKVEVQPKCKENTLPKTELPQPCGIFADCNKTIPEVNNVVPTTIENEVKSSDTGEREKSPISDTESGTYAEGWTFLQEEEANKSGVDHTKANKPSTAETHTESEKTVNYPNIATETESSTIEQNSACLDEGNLIRTNDPHIINALIKMQAMGFTNEGGWLERLLVTKKGNINEALDALYPFAQRH